MYLKKFSVFFWNLYVFSEIICIIILGLTVVQIAGEDLETNFSSGAALSRETALLVIQ